MTLLNYFILLFSLFAASRAILRFKGNESSGKELLFWLSIWFTILTIVIFPSLSTNFAKLIGIGRGVDSAFFISILLLFYLIFRLYVKIESLDKHLTDLSIKISKELHNRNNGS